MVLDGLLIIKEIMQMEEDESEQLLEIFVKFVTFFSKFEAEDLEY